MLPTKPASIERRAIIIKEKERIRTAASTTAEAKNN